MSNIELWHRRLGHINKATKRLKSCERAFLKQNNKLSFM